MNDWCPYVAVIEDADGHTYEQPFWDYEDMAETLADLGPDYRLITVY